MARWLASPAKAIQSMMVDYRQPESDSGPCHLRLGSPSLFTVLVAPPLLFEILLVEAAFILGLDFHRPAHYLGASVVPLDALLFNFQEPAPDLDLVRIRWVGGLRPGDEALPIVA